MEVYEKATIPRLNGIGAITAFVGMETCLACLAEIEKTDLLFLKAALVGALCVNYARSFEPVRDLEEFKDRTFKIRDIEGFDRQIHGALCRMRDKYVAHAGHGVNDYEMIFTQVNATATLTNKDGDIGDVSLEHRLGSKGRAAIAIGFSPAITRRMRDHFTTIRTAAGSRLITSILEHQTIIFNRVQSSGSTTHPDDDPVVTVAENKIEDDHDGKEWVTIFKYSEEDFLNSTPVNIEEIEIDFVGLHFLVVKKSENEWGLQMIVRNGREAEQ